MNNEILQKLNASAVEMVIQYRELIIHNHTISTPYFMNNIQGYFTSLMKEAGINDEKITQTNKLYTERRVPFGWYRGKGTPEEIKSAVEELAIIHEVNLTKTSQEGMRDYMNFAGIGVDCSGFVYNVLRHAFEKHELFEIFNNSLDWADSEKQGVTRAGAFVFAGNASILIKPEDVRELDLVLIKDSEGKYNHIALFISQEGKIKISQSTLSLSPAGVHIHDYEVVDSKPKFGFKPNFYMDWEEMYEKGILEFRRLKVLA